MKHSVADYMWLLKKYLLVCYKNFKLNQILITLKEENKKLKSYVDLDFWEEDVRK